MKQIALRLPDHIAAALDRRAQKAAMKREPYIKALIVRDIASQESTANPKEST